MPEYSNKRIRIEEPYKSILDLLEESWIKGKMYLKAEDFLNKIKYFNKIKTGSDRLNKCLRVLNKKGWIEKEGKPRYYKYFLQSKFYSDAIIDSKKKEFDEWMPELIITDNVFDNIMKEAGFSNEPKLMFKTSTWELFGLDHIQIQNLSTEDKKKLNLFISNVKKNLEDLIEFKLNILGINSMSDKEVNKILKKLNNNEQWNLLNIGFTYLGTPIHKPKIVKQVFKKDKSKK